jgi:NAD(P)-dependent dehydrogenase (short-subunit alcohol dehydrogenase family)
MRDLSGKVIVITGASSGIGAATAIECARSGMKVVLGGRRVDRLEEVALRVRDVGGEAAIVVGDVTDESNVTDLLDEAVRSFGGFDVVFSNAGYGTEVPFTAMTEEALRAMFEVNFFASVTLCREAAHRWMDEGRGGHLLLCSSCLSKFTLAYYGVYAATKASQAMVARSMRHELAGHGIEVSSVHPVTTRTEFFEVSAERSGFESGDSTVPDHAPKAFIQTPERVARAVVKCLRSPRSEVWTSWLVRFASALFTLWPGLQDLVIRRQAAQDRHRHDPRRPSG